MGTKAPGSADAEDFPLDSQEREDAALASAGALCSPSDIIADYGDGNSDHSDNQHTIAWERTEIDEPYFDGAEIYTFKEND